MLQKIDHSHWSLSEDVNNYMYYQNQCQTLTITVEQAQMFQAVY